MNPYRKSYTDAERARIEAGQAALKSRWSQPPFTDGQPATFAAHIGATSMNGASIEQAFVMKPAAPALTAAWDRELRRLGLAAPEHGAREFTVYVPHTLHLRAGWLPCSYDAPCIGQSLLYGGAAVLLTWLAYSVA